MRPRSRCDPDRWARPRAADLFFRDLPGAVFRDDVFARLLTFPNVVVTGHQAFFTMDALSQIARTTFDNLDRFADTGQPLHPVSVERIAQEI